MLAITLFAHWDVVSRTNHPLQHPIYVHRFSHPQVIAKIDALAPELPQQSVFRYEHVL